MVGAAARVDYTNENNFASLDDWLYSTETHNLGGMTKECPHCCAMFFPVEVQNKGKYKCCQDGTLAKTLAEMQSLHSERPYPEDLRNYFTGDDSLSKNFRENIRRYNNACAFASFAHVSIEPPVRGPKTFNSHGQTYHKTSDLEVGPGQSPSYSQLYILDS